MKPWILKFSAILLSTAALSACSQTKSPNMSSKDAILSQYHWQLQTATDQSQQTLNAFYGGQSKPEVQVDFQEGMLNVHGSCNRMGGSYQINGNHIQSSSLRSTLMGCPDVKAQQDGALGSFFDQQSLQYQINDQATTPILTLKNQQGHTLRFQGKPTAQTKYGNQVETMFLEVSHQTKTCSDGNRQKQCLQVKEVRYNEGGLKTYTDPQWRVFHDPIEGYTHRADTDTILRLQRYTLSNPPTDASRYAYVLDMVVMQSRAP